MQKDPITQSVRSEYLLLLITVLSLIASCIIISSKKYFWNDELYSYYLLADRSFLHMLGAFHDKINNTPPLYFILGWLWARLFGADELSLRLFSSLGICVAYITVWITLRRTYNFWATSLGTLAVFCTSEIILSQNAEARMYGLFLAVCSLGVLNFDTINKTSKISKTVILLNILINAAIVNTHLFGLFYSGAILFALIVRDRYFKLFRSKIYLSYIISWFSLLSYLPSFLNQSDAGNPRSWIPVPSFKDLTNLFIFSSSSFLIKVIFFTIFISGLLLIFNFNIFEQSQALRKRDLRSELSLLILAYCFLAVPVFVWLVSHTIKPIFWNRYFIPGTIGWSLLLTYIFSLLIDSFVLHNFCKSNSNIRYSLLKLPSFLLLLTLTLILITHPLDYAKSLNREQLPGINDDQYGYNNLPIVVQFSHDFLTRLRYSSESQRYFFILDWQAAFDSHSGLFPPQQYKHMMALKNNYPQLFVQNIVDSKSFLKKYSSFLVLDYLDYQKQCKSQPYLSNFNCPQWVEKRLLNNSNYQVEFLEEIYGESILLVERNQ